LYAGSFIHTGGTHTVSNDLSMAGSSGAGCQATYTLSGGGSELIVAEDMTVGHANTATFTQTGGKCTVTEDLIVGRDIASGITATCDLSNTAELSAENVHLGYQGAGTGKFIQTGGVVTVGDSLYVSRHSSAKGSYELAGGQLTASEEIVGSHGNGSFIHTAGKNTITGRLRLGYASTAHGTYEISGTGELNADTVWVGDNGTGAVTQNGGTADLGYLSIQPGSHYYHKGGSLTVSDGVDVDGTLDFDNKAVSTTMSGVVDFVDGSVTQSGSANLELGTDSLMLVPAGFDPNAAFSSFIDNGSIVHTVGSTLNVPAGKTIAGRGSITDFVDCYGTISAASGQGIDLHNGLLVHNTAIVNLGTGNHGGELTVDDAVSEIDGGQLTAAKLYFGRTPTVGTFTQDGGSNVVDELYLSYDPSSHWTYRLTGGGQLSPTNVYVGRGGLGLLTQDSGTHTVESALYVGYWNSGDGTVRLEGTGELSAEEQYVGRYGKGKIEHVAGTNTVHDCMYLGYGASGEGTYELSGASSQLTALYEDIGESGTGTFTQNDGTHTVNAELCLGCYSSGDGTYHLNDGTLSCEELTVGWDGTGTFEQTGGSNTMGFLSINDSSSYTFSGGTFVVKYGADIEGTLDCGSQPVTMTMGGLVYIDGATLENTSSATLNISPNSLLVVSPGYHPATDFQHFNGNGALVHEAGATLVVPAGKEVSGWGIIEDPLDCRGTITASTGYGISLFNTWSASGNAALDLGTGIAIVEDTSSTMSGGQMSALAMAIGATGGAEFNHAGGTILLTAPYDALCVGCDSGTQGTYRLSGAAQLSSKEVVVGYAGRGAFLQDGGVNTIQGTLWIEGVPTPPDMTGLTLYEISAGTLVAENVFVGWELPGVLLISGAAADITVSDTLYFGPNSIFVAVAGTTIHMTGSAFENEAESPEQLPGLNELELVFEGGSEDIDPFEVAGQDRGADMDGFLDNFALAALTIGGADVGQVQLVDEYDNWGDGDGNELLYVESLYVGPGSLLDLNGEKLYYLTATVEPGATVVENGGALVPIPEPSTLLLAALGLLGLVGWTWRRRR